MSPPLVRAALDTFHFRGEDLQVIAPAGAGELPRLLEATPERGLRTFDRRLMAALTLGEVPPEES